MASKDLSMDAMEQGKVQGEALACATEGLSSPFLLRFHAGHFRISLGLSSQALLLQTLQISQSFHLDPKSYELLLVIIWFISVFILMIFSSFYSLRCIFYFEAVKQEYMDKIRVNYLFVPWISAMLLALSTPTSISDHINPFILFIFMTPLLLLELKIYGQWFLGGKSRLLSRVANPSTQLCVVGNFVGATLAAKCGWKESAVFLFAVGISHYIVLFVTLYQKLPSNSSIPKQLQPVLFLFMALPSTACVAWESIAGSFEKGARITYFLALFSFMALVVRINLFRGIRFSAAWWACAFPLNSLAIATIHYAQEMSSPIVKLMADIFSIISMLCVLFLCLATIINIQTGLWKKYKSIRNIQH